MDNYLLGAWRPLFGAGAGIDHAVGLALTAFGGGPPREQPVNLVRIALKQLPIPGFFTTPQSGEWHTVTSTVCGFLADNQAAGVMLAINGAFGWAADTSFKDPQPAVLFGLAKSQGAVVCDPTVPAPQPVPPGQADVPDATYTAAVVLAIAADNSVSFQTITAACPGEGPPWPSIQTAVAGGPNPRPGWPPQPLGAGLQPGALMVLQDGTNNGIAPGSGEGQQVAGRTAVGLSADGETLFLLTVDGLEGAAQPYGATFYDVGCWLSIAGAWNGITLDGGGSSAMAMINEQGSPVLINNPHGQETGPFVQRFCPQFLGVIPGGGGD